MLMEGLSSIKGWAKIKKQNKTSQCHYINIGRKKLIKFNTSLFSN